MANPSKKPDEPQRAQEMTKKRFPQYLRMNPLPLKEEL